jgi:hypothetical protein
VKSRNSEFEIAGRSFRFDKYIEEKECVCGLYEVFIEFWELTSQIHGTYCMYLPQRSQNNPTFFLSLEKVVGYSSLHQCVPELAVLSF